MEGWRSSAKLVGSWWESSLVHGRVWEELWRILGWGKIKWRALGTSCPWTLFLYYIFLNCYKWISDLLKTKNNSLAMGMKGNPLEEAWFREKNKKILVFFLAMKILFFSLFFSFLLFSYMVEFSFNLIPYDDITFFSHNSFIFIFHHGLFKDSINSILIIKWGYLMIK